MAIGNQKFQLIWGIALVLAGLGVFYRIPQAMPRIEKIAHFSGAGLLIQACFYIMGIILVGGGVRKIVGHYRKEADDRGDESR